MENASKALIIAGGILLSIFLISVLLTVYNQINENQRAKVKVLETEEVAKFNAFYESYNKDLVYGAEILTLINKAKEDDKRGIKIEILDGFDNPIEIHSNNPDEKRQTYRCYKIEYDSKGRVKVIYFNKI